VGEGAGAGAGEGYHVEVAERHELSEALRGGPLVQAWWVAQALAELVLLEVGYVQDRGELLRLGLGLGLG
jgi:hypothetical protein